MNAQARLAICSLFLFLGTIATARGEDFRIDTKVYLAEETEPISQTVTLFQEEDGIVYDFLSEPKQIAIFRKLKSAESGTFILLDPVRQVRTDFTTEEVLLYSRGLQDLATTQKDSLLKFSANPDFKEAFDEREKTLTLTSDRMKYRLLTIPCSPVASQQYKEFSDWYVRAAARMHQGPILPFPRLMVNAALARHQVIPAEVHLEVPASSGHQQLVVHSKHEVLFLLSQKDRQEIEKAKEQLAKFKKVDIKEFQGDLYSASK
jgi:hypothetical protein